MPTNQPSIIGESLPRLRLPEALTGEAKFVADIKLPGMLHGKVLRSPYAHARIAAIDAGAAARLPGVHAVLTPNDAPHGRVAPDMPILDTEVRFVGDEVAAVAAEDEETAQGALGLIEVEYQPLPFVTDARFALEQGAPPVHAGGNLVGGKPLTLARGDVDEGFAQADRIFEETFTTPAHSPASLEPRVAIAAWEADRLTVWKASRGVHMDQRSLAMALEIPHETIRVICPHMGAGYGGKDETRLAVLAAVLAQRARRPVKIELTREEEIVAGRTRHATVTTVKVGVKNDGAITAIHATTIMDTGAYIASGPGVVRRAGQGALYLYRCANVRYDGYLVYTNRPAAGSYRALGAPQGHFALEATMDKIALELGIDPLEFRLRNHVGLEGQPGRRTTPDDQILDSQPVEGGVPFSSNGLRQCLEEGARAIGWQARQRPQGSGPDPIKRGVGMSMFLYRGGPGAPSRARLRLDPDGTVELVTGIVDVGEGASTVLAQMAAAELGVAYDRIRVSAADTASTPVAPITAGSTVTFSSGLAVRQAASELKSRVIEAAAGMLELEPHQLELIDGSVTTRAAPRRAIDLAEVAQRTVESPLEVEASVMPGSRDSVVNSFGAHFAEVEVDTGTGQVRVLRYVAAHDSGVIINPALATNQVEGGVGQMLGFTLTEEIVTDGRTGATLNGSFLEHKCPTILDVPDIEVIFVDVVDPVGPFGAKALGEPPCVGVAPTIVNAIYDAIGIRIHDLPVTPDRILNAIQLNERG
ncbi:MAG: molybdopterin-dependent oxidoreductase [Chloroflexi bacterium]|nr:molybdopterin-dependent oxidoreductase [Chloroflexota bacterium]